MSSNLVSRVVENIREIVSAGDHVVVGLSGGVDSVVLLDILARLSARRRLGLAALHVNHQLSPNARHWEAFCRKLCRDRGIPLRVVRVRVARGDSLEAAAREARYHAFRRLRAEYVALAHNQDDQAETVLLQLLRGAGVKGLAAMPVVRREERGERREAETQTRSARRLTPHLSPLTSHVLRPLLDATRAEIEAYARARGLAWIEDESNADRHFLRNFLRVEVLPLIAARFPSYRTTLARAARNFAEAAQLLDELGAKDGDGYLENGTLAVAALRRLTPARARNLLRYFLSTRGVTMPNTDRLNEALRQAVTAKQDARVLVELGDAHLRRYAGRLYLLRKGGPLPARWARRWCGESELTLPELGGVLVLSRGLGAGIKLARLHGRSVTIGVRRGGERLRPDCRRPRRSLKNLLQEARVPPWERERAPLIFCDGELVWAAGVGVDCAYRSARNEPALRPIWKPFA